KTPRILQGPKSDRAMLTELREALSRGEPFSGETVNYRKDGSEYYVEWDITPIRTSGGKISHFLSIQRNVTDFEGSIPGDPLADEKERFLQALERSRGNRALAARLLGISRATLYRRLADLKISSEEK